ncbi:MAG: 5-formyltetrahydrofolate cyclo-ligase [Chthoniobacterales bacterium]
MRAPGDQIPAQKAALRTEILQILRALTAAERTRRSALICERLADLEAWRRAHRILFFTPFPSEPDIQPLFQSAPASGKEVAMIPNTLAPGEALQIPFVPDLVLVPGLAFSAGGHRLGRGNGVYDRLLAGELWDAATVGICFRLQLRDHIPLEDHDVILDAVVHD